jgi:hypothetical protein
MNMGGSGLRIITGLEGLRKNHDKTSVRPAAFLAEISTQDLSNT